MIMHKKDEPILVMHLGDCEYSDGSEYTLSSSLTGEMVVKSDKTGKSFQIEWDDAIKLAVGQGLNEEDSEDVE